MYECIERFQLDSQVRTGYASPVLKGVWHKYRLLNYPWVDTRPAKYHTENAAQRATLC